MTESTPTQPVEEEASSLMRQERWHEAASLLERQEALASNWRMLWNLGWCYYRLEQFDVARKHLVRAARLAPKDPICKWALGNVYLKKGQFKKAQRILESARRIKNSHPGRTSLALAYLSQGMIAKAEELHKEGIRLRPDFGPAYESYAAFLYDVGREQEALEMEKMAKQKVPR